MKTTLSLSLVFAIGSFLSQPLLAKPKDGDEKQHGKKDKKSHAVADPTTRQSSVAPQLRTLPQSPITQGQRDTRRSSQTQLAPTFDAPQPRLQSGRTGNTDRYRNDDRGWSQYQYYNAPSSAYRSWDTGRSYSWNNQRYHWYDGSWVIIVPHYDYSESRTTYSYVGSGQVRDVQSRLTRSGYDPGPVDGVMGGQTRRAIQQFQSDHDLRATGRIDRTLMAALDRG